MQTAVGIIASAKTNTSGGPVVPTDIPNIQSWYDANDDSTITYATAPKISQWRDKSGLNNHFSQASTSNQPDRGLNAIKTGMNTINFATSSKYMTTPLGADTKPCTCFAVIKHAGGATDRVMIGTTQTNGFLWELRPDQKQLVNQHLTANIGNSTSVVPANGVQILCVTYSATGVLAFYLNNVADGGTTNNKTLNPASPITTTGDGNAQPFVGSIGELIRYSRVLTGTEITDIYNYLYNKWAGNGAARFSAANQALTRVATGLTGTDATMCCWVNLAVDRDTYSSYLCTGDGGSNYWQMSTSSTGTLIGRQSNSGDGYGTYDLVVGTWVFAAATYSIAGPDTFYWAVAGTPTLSQQNLPGGGPGVGNLLIGSDSYGSFFNGSVAAVKIWTAELTKTELELELTKYAAQKTANLWGAYSFKYGPQLTDDSGNGRTLTAGAANPALMSVGPPIT